MAKKKELIKQLEEANRIALEMQNEYKKLLEENEKSRLIAKTNIDAICNEKYYCGVQLTKEDIVTIIQLAFTTNEKILIPYELYELEEKEIINEDENGTI